MAITAMKAGQPSQNQTHIRRLASGGIGVPFSTADRTRRARQYWIATTGSQQVAASA